MESSAGEMAESKPVPQSQQVCRFFSQGRHCNFGKKCKFLHISDNTRASTKNVGEGPLDSRGVGEHEGSQLSSSSRASVSAGRRPCRYFLSGHCAMEERCRFWHPLQFPPEDVTLVPGNPTKAAPRCPPATYPSGPQEVKLCDVTEERANQLRDTEIKQLQKRFPKEQLIIQERSDGKVTYYRMTVEATDPDWPFDLKELDIMVRFPDNYPLEIFSLEIPLDQELPPVMAKHVQDASIEWLQAKHATNQLLGKVELLFRPFLRWLDRSLERLFTEGARELKKDVDLQKAGLQFIPYQELQQSCEKSGQGTDSAAAHCDEEVCNAGDGELITQEQSSQQEGQCFEDDQQQEEEASRLVENIKISDPRRGTEVKLLGLSLGENTTTVAAQQITVSLQCNRCKVTAELALTGRTSCAAQCEKCNASINAAFRPCMLHHYCNVLGYLDLHNTTPTDLILQDCRLIVGCLACSQEMPVENLIYGQTRELNCEHCHSKLSILAESARFQYIQPRTSNKAGQSQVILVSKWIRLGLGFHDTKAAPVGLKAGVSV